MIWNTWIPQIPCCDVRYDFRIKTMFGSSFPSVVCEREKVIVFTLFVFVCYGGVQHIFWCVFVLLFIVLCALCCQFLWIVLFLIPRSLFSDVYLLPKMICITINPTRGTDKYKYRIYYHVYFHQYHFSYCISIMCFCKI